jgi:hypothetical protein
MDPTFTRFQISTDEIGFGLLVALILVGFFAVVL